MLIQRIKCKFSNVTYIPFFIIKTSVFLEKIHSKIERSKVPSTSCPPGQLVSDNTQKIRLCITRFSWGQTLLRTECSGVTSKYFISSSPCQKQEGTIFWYLVEISPPGGKSHNIVEVPLRLGLPGVWFCVSSSS